MSLCCCCSQTCIVYHENAWKDAAITTQGLCQKSLTHSLLPARYGVLYKGLCSEFISQLKKDFWHYSGHFFCLSSTKHNAWVVTFGCILLFTIHCGIIWVSYIGYNNSYFTLAYSLYIGHNLYVYSHAKCSMRMYWGRSQLTGRGETRSVVSGPKGLSIP